MGGKRAKRDRKSAKKEPQSWALVMPGSDIPSYWAKLHAPVPELVPLDPEMARGVVKPLVVFVAKSYKTDTGGTEWADIPSGDMLTSMVGPKGLLIDSSQLDRDIEAALRQVAEIPGWPDRIGVPHSHAYGRPDMHLLVVAAAANAIDAIGGYTKADFGDWHRNE